MTSVSWVELAGTVIAREQLLELVELVDRLNGAGAADAAAVLLIAGHDSQTAAA